MPATTCSNRYRERSEPSSPNRSESSTAIGLAPRAKTSRRIPPTPVAAPWNGSTALGWLWDSTLNATAYPSPMSTAPAFSPGPMRTREPSVGSRRRSFRECLYAQCSDQSRENIASSTSLGSRSRSSVIRSYSKSVSPSSRCLDSLVTLIADPVSRVARRSAAASPAPSAKSAPEVKREARNRPRDAGSHPPPQAGLDPPKLVCTDAQGLVATLEALPELPDARPLLSHLRSLTPALRRPLGLRLEVAADRVHRVVAQLLGRRSIVPFWNGGRASRAAAGEGIGTVSQVVTEAGLLDQPALLDALRHRIVVEDQAAVHLLELSSLVRLPHRPPLLVALELPVVARDLHPPPVLLEGAEREVENSDRKRRCDHELDRIILAMLRLRPEHRLSHQSPVGLA